MGPTSIPGLAGLVIALAAVFSPFEVTACSVCDDTTGQGGTGSLCDCSRMPDGRQRVNCTGKMLSSIPNIPPNTGVLDLTNNSIAVIDVSDLHVLDTLSRLILNDNPLNCDCPLTDFKNWMLNLMTVDPSTVVAVEGAVCGDEVNKGQNVVDTEFCLGSIECHQCNEVSPNDPCDSDSCFVYFHQLQTFSVYYYCQNKVTYFLNGSTTITKTCADLNQCLAAASLVNEDQCHQTDQASSHCIYCCQGELCNKALNTVNDTLYTFPFRRPVALTTEEPNTTGGSTVGLASTTTSQTTHTDNGVQSTQPRSTTENTRTENEATPYRTESTQQPSEPRPSTTNPHTANTATPNHTESTQRSSEPRPSTTNPQAANTATPDHTESTQQSSEPRPSTTNPQAANTATPNHTGTESTQRSSEPRPSTTNPQTANTATPDHTESTQRSSEPRPSTTNPQAANTATPDHTESTQQSSEPRPSTTNPQAANTATPNHTGTESTQRSSEPRPSTTNPQTANTATPDHTESTQRSSEPRPSTTNSQTANAATPSNTDSSLQSTERRLVTESSWTSDRETSPSLEPVTEAPDNTQQPHPTASGTTQEPHPTVGLSTSGGADPDGHFCPSETTEGDKGVVSWPETGVNLTAVVPCPYSPLGDSDTIRHTSRYCSWDATNGQAVWSEPDMEKCSSVEDILEELINVIITEENVLDVAQQIQSVTSHPVAMKADEVTSTVDVLSSLLETLRRYPEKGQTVFHNALATAGQMTRVKVEELEQSQRTNRTSSKLLQLVDDFALLVQLLNSSSLTSESRAVDVILLDTVDQDIGGLLFGGSREDHEDDIKPFLGLNGSTPENATSVVASVALPFNLVHAIGVDPSRIQFSVYQDTTYYDVITSSTGSSPVSLELTTEGATSILNSAVISASLGNLSVVNLTEPVIIRLELTNKTVGRNPRCVFWDPIENDNQGGWSTEGCSLNSELSDPTTVVCECNHLTNFAMFMDVYDSGAPADPVHSKILDIISYVGCSLSIVTLTLAVITLGCCKEKTKYRTDRSGSLNSGTPGKSRSDRHTNILLHLAVGLILSDACFLMNTVTVKLDLDPVVCRWVAVASHFSLLVSMAWMALEAFNMYLALVLIFETYFSRFMLKMCVVGWGVPVVIVATTLSINFPANYGLNNGICWLDRTAFLASFLAPVCTVLLFNGVVFLSVTWQLCKMRRRNISQSRRGFDLAAQFKASVSITCLFGLTWSFGLFGIGEANLAFSYLFAIFNSAQGFNIFIFQCLMKPSIRQRWMKILKRQEGDISASSKLYNIKDSRNLDTFRMSASNNIDTTE